MGRNIVETIVGALVLVVAGVFVFYAFAKSDHNTPSGYDLTARFGRIDRRAQIACSMFRPILHRNRLARRLALPESCQAI